MKFIDIKVTTDNPDLKQLEINVTVALETLAQVVSTSATGIIIQFPIVSFKLEVPKNAFISAVLTPDINLPIDTTIIEGDITTYLKIYNA